MRAGRCDPNEETTTRRHTVEAPAILLTLASLAVLTPRAVRAQDMTQLREIGVATGSPSYTFDRIQDIAIDGAGRIFVLDGGDRAVRVYDAQGRFVRRIGREGQGPGEFAVPVRLRVRGDTVTVTDARLFRISRFRPDGTHIETVPLPAPAGLGLSDLRVLRGGFQLVITIFRASLGNAATHDPYVRALLLRPDGTTGIAQWYDAGADGLVPVRRTELGVRSRPVTDDDRRAADAALHARNPNLPARIEFVMPPARSAVTGRAFFDDAHGLWVELNGDDGSQGRVWARVAADGALSCASAPTQLTLRAVRGDAL